MISETSKRSTTVRHEVVTHVLARPVIYVSGLDNPQSEFGVGCGDVEPDRYRLAFGSRLARSGNEDRRVVNFFLSAKKVAGRRLLHWSASPYLVLEFCMSFVRVAPIALPGDS